MGSWSVNEVSTSGRTNESDNEGEIGLEQFMGFPSKLVSYPHRFDTFREFCKAKAAVGGNSAQPNLVKPSKVAQKYLKKRILKALPASGTTGSGEVSKNRRRRVEPSGESGEKAAEGRSASVDDLKEVEERARLAVLQGEEDTSKMVASLVKLIWLALREEKSKLKKVEAKANLDKMVEERDRLRRHLMLKGYYEEEVDAIKADTYVEEEDEEEADVVGIVDGLDDVSRQTVLDNQGDDVELPEGGREKVG
ncbi:hypothetical protein GIB67_041594 [Kingdonia uniflora]|uniref:Uncharacterized protein n=1 Tax=Kingdonia uniflora TaxID=39325 RepID=A0A7J7MQH4_9MAGN|nr:hypothetical protein GIB67_041594 [Kingdonia uniflora]